MTEIDAELIERVARWCAEAGRHAVISQIRRALAPLSWDEILAARALLADPPPTRPLGPFALADLARGAPADVAAEREREGRYRSLEDAAVEARPEDAKPEDPRRARPRRGARRPPKARGVVIRRARDVVTPAPPEPLVLPQIDELLREEGRSVVERLVRAHGARRPALVSALAMGWRRNDGEPPGEADLARLLDHHGLTRAFERRERDDILHAVRAAGGVLTAAAARLGLDLDRLAAALARLGAAGEAEQIREHRRADLRARATLSERVRLVLTDRERLRDLGMLAEFEEDLRARLPEHVRALRSSGALATALARSLSLTPVEARTLTARFGLGVEPRATAGPRTSRFAAARQDRSSRPGGHADAPTSRRPRPPRGGGATPRGRDPRGR